MPKIFRIPVIAVCGWIFFFEAMAQTLSMPRIYSDGMVLQCDRPLMLHGHGEPGAPIKATLAEHAAETVADSDGHWQLEFPALSAGGPFRLAVSSQGESLEFDDVLIGEVWFCSGQSNMYMELKNCDGGPEFAAAAENPRIRFFNSPLDLSPAGVRDDLLGGHWQRLEPGTAADFSGLAIFFAVELEARRGVPVGVIGSSFGGTPIEAWIGRDAFASDGDASCRALAERIDTTRRTLAPGERLDWNFPATLYNCMVAPWTRYPIRGVLWYQGETNAGNPSPYAGLLRLLIGSWRKAWGDPDMPVILVQLAAFENYQPGTPLPDGYFAAKPSVEQDGWCEIRRIQAAVAEQPGVGLASAIDLGNPIDIHPRAKAPLAKRLTEEALRLVYRYPVVSRGPVAEGLCRDGDSLEIRFEDVGSGLISLDGEALRNFAVAGRDGVFYPAEAVIIGSDQVRLRSAAVSDPVTAAYAELKCPVRLNFYNREGYPALPFRLSLTEVSPEAKDEFP